MSGRFRTLICGPTADLTTRNDAMPCTCIASGSSFAANSGRFREALQKCCEQSPDARTTEQIARMVFRSSASDERARDKADGLRRNFCRPSLGCKSTFEENQMPSLSIFCGVPLILIGILGYVTGVMSDRASYTALIPAIFGALLLLFGLIAQAKENLRQHLMHAAVVVALLGFIATAVRLIPRLGKLTYSRAPRSRRFQWPRFAFCLSCLPSNRSSARVERSDPAAALPCG